MKNGVESRARSIRIHFQYRGKRCRETINIPPTAKNIKYAENKRASILYEIEVGTFDYVAHFPDSEFARIQRARESGKTVRHFVSLWRDSLNIKPSTKVGYDGCIRRFIEPEFGDRDITSVLKSELDIWRSNIAKKYRPKTVNNALIPMRGAFATAYGDGIIERDPAAELRNVRNPNRNDTVDPFSLEEVEALITHAKKETNANMIDFWFASGLRSGEIMALHFEDIDFENATLNVCRNFVNRAYTSTKTHDQRLIDLHKRALSAAKRQRALLGRDTGVVFPSPATGRVWNHSEQLRRSFMYWCKHAGVRYRYPYQMRHTYASTMLSLGEPAIYVMRQMGHSSLSMMERHYARWMRSVNGNAGSAFDALTSAR